MAKRIVMEEFHLTVRVPRSPSVTDFDPMRQTLANPVFEARPRRAVPVCFQQGVLVEQGEGTSGPLTALAIVK